MKQLFPPLYWAGLEMGDIFLNHEWHEFSRMERMERRGRVSRAKTQRSEGGDEDGSAFPAAFLGWEIWGDEEKKKRVNADDEED